MSVGGVVLRSDALARALIINHVLTVIKYFIHLCRHKDSQPTVSGLKARILYTEYLERQIATRKNKLDYHDQKWQGLIDIINS